MTSRRSDAQEAALAAAYLHGPGKSLWIPPQSAVLRSPPGGAPIPLAEMALSTMLGPALAQTLKVALAPRRWEPWNAHNDHRAYPSPRSLNLTDVTVRVRRQHWLIDPVRLVVHPGGRPDPSARREGEGPAGAGPRAATRVTLALFSHPDRMPAGYGTLRDAAALLEAGHVSAALAEAACAHGLRPIARFAGSNERVAVDGAPVALVELAAATSDSASATAPARGAIAAWQQRVQAPRSSGLGSYGRLSADPRPLPMPLWRSFIAACAIQPPGSLAAAAGPSASWLRHRLAVGNVEGIDDGVYEWRDGRLARCAGPALAELQDAFRFGQDVVDVAGMNVVWVMAAGLTRLVADHGAAAYRRTLLTAGAAAQHVCSAAAANRMFCRPVRSIEEPATEAAVGLPSAEDAVYTLLIGRPRVIDFSYDLTEPREMP